MGELANRISLYFTNPKVVEVREEPVPPLQPQQVLIRTLYSAISPGTELLIYRHLVSTHQPLDTNIQSLAGSICYPLKYGYSAVGEVVASGAGVDSSWLGKKVFVFHPHESLFSAALAELIEIPEGISALDAVFLPNIETAVNFIMDGHPGLGEQVVVLGQGIVGLLTTALLSQFPLKNLITLDPIPMRRQMSQQLGAQYSFDPSRQEDLLQLNVLLRGLYSSGADLTYEISGNPQALNQAIEFTGFEGRVVVGSWYGSKPVYLKLDETFHRSRINLISSQVSTIGSSFQGRWNKSRRFQIAWNLIDRISPSRFISRELPITQAADAYRMLDETPDEVIQIIFTYPDSQERHV
jgi:2-desacetyl-2-hydroxyethyl bacteriochlorophyllide A dehydrogenase